MKKSQEETLKIKLLHYEILTNAEAILRTSRCLIIIINVVSSPTNLMDKATFLQAA